jgi:hypothetical protein
VSPQEDGRHTSEFDLWRTEHPPEGPVSIRSTLRSRVGRIAWEARLRLEAFFPLYNPKIPEIGRTVADSAHSLVVADGSAMHVARTAGREAERVHVSRWRVPWEVPDNTLVDIPVGDAVSAESFHFELRAPAGTVISSAVLRIPSEELPTDDTGDTRGRSEIIFVEDDDAHLDRAHLHFTKALSTLSPERCRYYPGCVRAILRPTWHDGLRAAVLAQAVSTATLAVLVVTFGLDALNGLGSALIPVATNGGSADALVALVTLAPAIGLSWIARQQEHLLTKRVQGRMRARLGTAALAAYGSALCVALGSTQPYVFWVLAILTGVSGVLFGVSLRSGLYSRRLQAVINRPEPTTPHQPPS